MFFADFEGTYNVIITLRTFALQIPPSGLSLGPLGRNSHALILPVIIIHYLCTNTKILFLGRDMWTWQSNNPMGFRME